MSPLPLLVGLAAYNFDWFGTDEEKQRYRDIPKITNFLKLQIRLIESGNVGQTDLEILPNTITIVPASRKQAYLQGAWYALLAATFATGQDRTTLLSTGKAFLNTSESLQDYYEDQDAAIIFQDTKAIFQTLSYFQQYLPANVYTVMFNHMNASDIAVEKDRLKKIDEETSIPTAVEGTIADAGDFFTKFGDIVKGALTGEKPRHMDDKQWKNYKRAIYGAVGAYLVLQLTPLAVPIIEEFLENRKEKRQKRLEEKGE